MDSSPKRRAVALTQVRLPRGESRRIARRAASTSPSACGWLTCSTQPGPQGNGRVSGQASTGSKNRSGERLDQRQSRSLDQRSPQGMTLDITEDAVGVFVLLDGKRLEAALMGMPVAHAVAMLLPPLDVRVGKPLHEVGKIFVTHRPEQKVPVVGHHAVAANRPVYQPPSFADDVRKNAR